MEGKLSGPGIPYRVSIHLRHKSIEKGKASDTGKETVSLVDKPRVRPFILK